MLPGLAHLSLSSSTPSASTFAPSPLSSELALSNSAESFEAPKNHFSEALYDQAEAEEERAELVASRAKAARAAGRKPSADAFDSFPGSRAGSPIPDNHGLGWPGARAPFPEDGLGLTAPPFAR
jgi:GTP cyclohydrolase I